MQYSFSEQQISSTHVNFSSDNDIAIVSMACRFPGAKNYKEFWQNIINGVNSITEIPSNRWDWRKYDGNPLLEDNKTNSKWGGFIDDIDKFDANFFLISKHEAKSMDPQQRILLELSWACFEEAGYTLPDLAGSKTGVFIGACNFDYKEFFNSDYTSIDGHAAIGNSNAILANRLSYLYDFHGPSITLDASCSSSLFAIHQAVQSLKLKECSLALVGGTNMLCTPTNYISFSKSGMLSPTGQCHSFDKSANGYVRGEGAGVILLKPLSQALKDRNQIRGIIKGTAVSHGGRVRTLTTPNPNLQAQVVIQAWEQSNISPEKIGYIETHGTGTLLGDPIELQGLEIAFKQLAKNFNQSLPKQYCAIGTVKTNIGHLEGAAGIAGVIKVLLCFQYKQLPKLQNFQNINPQISLIDKPFYLLNKNHEWNQPRDELYKSYARYAGVSSFGFGGTNAHVALEEPPSYVLHLQQKKPHYLITLSAKHLDVLMQRKIDLFFYIEDCHNLSLECIAYTLNAKRRHFKYRYALVVSSITELKEKLQLLTSNKITDYWEGKVSYSKDIASDKEVLAACMEKLIQPELEESEYEKLLKTLADLYAKGYDLDWEILHYGETKQVVILPTYPFLRETHWILNKKFISSLDSCSKSPSSIIKNFNVKSSNEIRDALYLRIVEEVADILESDKRHINSESGFVDMGMDSITGMKFHARLEKIFDLSLPITLIFDYPNVDALVTFLEKHL